MRKKFFVLIFGILFIAAGYGICVSSPSSSISSYYSCDHPIGPTSLSAPICQPPCWENIIPGQTTMQEAEQSLSQFPIGRIESINKNFSGNQGKKVYAVYFCTQDRALIDFQDGIVQKISYEDDLNPQFKIREVLQQFGEPEAVVSNFRNPNERCPASSQALSQSYSAQRRKLFQYLIFPKQGMNVTFLVPEEYHGCIHPEMRVIKTTYFRPISIAEALKLPSHPLLSNLMLDNDDIVTWHGYGVGY